MSTSVGGKRREVLEDFGKKVGLFECKVIAINPDAEAFKNVLNIDLPEDSKLTEYLGTSRDGNTSVRIDFWLEAIKDKAKYRVSFFLEDKPRMNKDGNKTQYINNVGTCSWAVDPNDLPAWFTARDYRVAYSGEEELYIFIRTWLGALDTRDAESILSFEWKKLMKGNVSDIRAQLGGGYDGNFVALATVKTVIKDDETKEYQGIYNKGFLPTYSLKQFRTTDYSNEELIKKLQAKKDKDLKTHEKFVSKVYGEHGCKEYFILRDIQDYNPEDNLVSTEEAMRKEETVGKEGPNY